MLVGEPLVVYKSYLNQGLADELEKSHDIMKQPLAEILYTLWYDYSYSKNKKNNRYIQLLKEVKVIFEAINKKLADKSPYSPDINQMLESLDSILPKYGGGAGRYRLAKVLTTRNVEGIIVVSSMYENTAAILKMLREKHKTEDTVPVLDLNFDCNKKGNHKGVIETFLNYV